MKFNGVLKYESTNGEWKIGITTPRANQFVQWSRKANNNQWKLFNELLLLNINRNQHQPHDLKRLQLASFLKTADSGPPNHRGDKENCQGGLRKRRKPRRW